MCSETRRSTRPKGVRGFSLLEALGATALVAGALLGLGMGAINVSQNSKSADATAAATSLAMERLEQLRSLPLDATGYVSWLTVAATVPTTLLTTRAGVALAHHLSRHALETAFGVFLLLVSARFLLDLL